MAIVAGSALTLGIPAFAASPVTPLFECVWDNGNGTSTAVFGYQNSSASAVTIPLGAQNSVSPSPPGPNAGQPTVFQPGTHHNVFVVTFSNPGGRVEAGWKIQDNNVQSDGPVCSTKPVPVVGQWWVAMIAVAVAAAVLARPRSRGPRLVVRAFRSPV